MLAEPYICRLGSFIVEAVANRSARCDSMRKYKEGPAAMA